MLSSVHHHNTLHLYYAVINNCNEFFIIICKNFEWWFLFIKTGSRDLPIIHKNFITAYVSYLELSFTLYSSLVPADVTYCVNFWYWEPSGWCLILHRAIYQKSVDQIRFCNLDMIRIIIINNLKRYRLMCIFFVSPCKHFIRFRNPVRVISRVNSYADRLNFL